MTIKIALNQGKVLELPCADLSPADVNTLARQISEAPLIYSTHVGDTTYARGKRR